MLRSLVVKGKKKIKKKKDLFRSAKCFPVLTAIDLPSDSYIIAVTLAVPR